MSHPELIDEPPRRRWVVRDESSPIFGGGGRFRLMRPGGVPVLATYSLPLAMLGLLGVALWPTSPSGVWVGMVLVIWSCGLLLQGLVAVVFFWLTGRYPESVTMTLTGIWLVPSGERLSERLGEGSSPEPTAPRAADVLALWAILLLILVAGAGWWMTWQQLQLNLPASPAEASSLLARAWWRMPSLGAAAVDQPYAAAAWLWCLQAIWQAIPLPQSLGRVGWSCLFALVSGGPLKDPRLSLLAMRRFLFVIAILFLAVAVWGMRLAIVATGPGEAATSIVVPSRGLLLGLVLMALWLFASASANDLARLQNWLAAAGETGQLRGVVSPTGWLSRLRRRRLERTQHRRLLEAIQHERQEASDAQQADEVLQRLHDSGLDSLSAEDRQLLARVSEAVRRSRS